MNLRRTAIVLLLCSAACGMVCYETYRFNADAVAQMATTSGAEQVFVKLEPGIPTRSKITGFFSVVLGIAGLRLLMMKPPANPLG